MSDDEMPSLADLMDGDGEEVSDVDYVAARVAESTRAGSGLQRADHVVGNGGSAARRPSGPLWACC